MDEGDDVEDGVQVGKRGNKSNFRHLQAEMTRISSPASNQRVASQTST